MTHLLSITCPCGCGQVVQGRDAGFSATTVEIDVCDAIKAAQGGILAPVAMEIRKSLAYQLAVPVSAGIQHRDGLVVFTG